MLYFLIKLFFIAFFLNLLYELLHSLLYKTCLEARLPKYIYLILKGAIFDGFFIMVIFLASSFFGNYFFYVFSALGLFFAYFWEIYSVKKGKWVYTSKMPKIFGAGLTPTIQLFLTGLLSIYLSTNL